MSVAVYIYPEGKSTFKIRYMEISLVNQTYHTDKNKDRAEDATDGRHGRNVSITDLYNRKNKSMLKLAAG